MAQSPKVSARNTIEIEVRDSLSHSPLLPHQNRRSNSHSLEQEQEKVGELSHDISQSRSLPNEIDYLNDLSKDIDPHELKRFIMHELQVTVLTLSDIEGLLKTGAEINKFLDVRPQTIKMMARMLDLPLDVDRDSSEGSRRLSTGFRLTSHFQNNLGFYGRMQTSQQLQNSMDNPVRILGPEHVTTRFSARNYEQPSFNEDELLGGATKTRKCLADQALKYKLWIVVLTLVSIGFFFIGDYMTKEAQRETFKSGLWIARGSAYSILVLTLLCILYIQRDLLTLLRCRECCGKNCSFMLNEHVIFHQICGGLILFYSLLHTAGHFYGTFPILSSEDTFDQANSILKHGFDSRPSYATLLFLTLPGLSGVILLLALIILVILALPCVRRKRWECFSFSHLLYLVYFIGVIVHGWERWFSDYLPISCVPFIAFFILLLAQSLRRWCQKTFYKTHIERIYYTQDKSYIYMKLFKPAGMVIQPGQYMFINIPKFSKFQWHPFSIASGVYDQTINFIIKGAGNFTNKLIRAYAPSRPSHANQFRREIRTSSGKPAKIMEIDEEQPEQDSEEKEMPQININGPFGAPCQSAVFKHTCVFVGLGVGLTPFLAFLRSIPRTIVFCTFVFICRDPELMNWISYTIKDLKLTKKELRKMQISLFLTKRREAHCLESFLFWRAFLKLQKRQAEYQDRGGSE